MESEMCVKNRTFEIKLAFSIFGLQMLRALLRSGRLCNALKERRSCRSLSEAGPGGEEDQQLLRELCAKIRFSGPITVAQYMQEVLTNPVHGIYTNKGPVISIGVLEFLTFGRYYSCSQRCRF